MRDYLIVDGYNIIYAWPMLEKYIDSDIEYARSKLVSILADYSSVRGQKVVVVFDAYKQKKPGQNPYRQKGAADVAEIINGVKVIYTKHGETADTLIERLTGELTAKGVVSVATSDWAEQVIIFGQGAYRITPGELFTMVNEVKETSRDLWTMSGPLDSYLENRLDNAAVRSRLEQWRRGKL